MKSLFRLDCETILKLVTVLLNGRLDIGLQTAAGANLENSLNIGVFIYFWPTFMQF